MPWARATGHTKLAKLTRVGKKVGTDTSSSPEALSLIDDLGVKLPFHEHRWMCITESDSAALCLGPSARLELTIVRARNIISHEASLIDRVRREPHPFVRVYLDDTRQCETAHVKNSRSPEWNSYCEVDITAGRSMIRLQVYDRSVEDVEAHDVLKGGGLSVADKKPHFLGFVEVCVGDMPFDEEICGWLELTFPNNLQGTNLKRYKQHCKRRREDVHREMFENMSSDLYALEQVSAKFRAHDHASPLRRGAHSLSKLKDRVTGHRGAATGHGHSDGNVSASPDDQVSASPDDQDHLFNAGELLVRMRLVRVGEDRYDDLFAHAIQPQALCFNPVILQEALPNLDVQEAFDDAMDIKYAVLDDFAFSFASYAWYLLSCQSRLLSGIITMCFVACCQEADLLFACFHEVLAGLLVLNYFEGHRREMTTSGLNAPLNHEGFRAVANRRSVLQMEAFLVRVVVARGGQIELERELRNFVTMAFRRGVPSATLEDVVGVLKTMGWVTFHGKDNEDIQIREGSLVRVRERRRATVEHVLAPYAGTGLRQVVVHYDETEKEGRRDWLDTETLYEDEVSARIVLPKIPRLLLTGKIKQEIRKVSWKIDSWKRGVIIPILRWISDLLTWKAPISTSILLAYLLLRALLATLHFLNPELPALGTTIWILRNLAYVCFFTALICSFIFLAQPLQFLFPLARMLTTWPTSGRRAPEIWPFLVPEDDPGLGSRGGSEPAPGTSTRGGGADEAAAAEAAAALEGGEAAAPPEAAPLIPAPPASRWGRPRGRPNIPK